MAKDFKYYNPEPIDLITDYGKGLEPKSDPRTDFGKGITYKSFDGREWATMEQVEQANKEYWDSMVIKPKGRGR